MRSRNPKKYMEPKTKDLSMSKFQPSRSIIFSKLPSVEEKIQKTQQQNKNDNNN